MQGIVPELRVHENNKGAISWDNSSRVVSDGSMHDTGTVAVAISTHRMQAWAGMQEQEQQAAAAAAVIGKQQQQ